MMLYFDIRSVENINYKHTTKLTKSTAQLTKMSRRALNPTADRAAQNQQALKSLVKIESNKSCADCKKNKRKYVLGFNRVCLPNLFNRSSMGELEPWYFYMHSVSALAVVVKYLSVYFKD